MVSPSSSTIIDQARGSLYLAGFCYLAHRLLRPHNWFMPLFVLPALWSGLEWLKGVLFTGFPWMDLGYSLSSVPLLIQSADIWGHLGISYLIVFINVFLVLLVTAHRSVASRAALILVAAGIVGSVLAYSVNRLGEVVRAETAGENTLVAGIAQGSRVSTSTSAPVLRPDLEMRYDDGKATATPAPAAASAMTTLLRNGAAFLDFVKISR